MLGCASARTWTIALCAASLCACAPATTPSPNAQGPATAAPGAFDAAAPATFTAEQLLPGWLDLIQATPSASELTAGA